MHLQNIPTRDDQGSRCIAFRGMHPAGVRNSQSEAKKQEGPCFEAEQVVAGLTSIHIFTSTRLCVGNQMALW